MISADELRRLETRCNLLLAAGEDCGPLVRAFEEQAGIRLRELRIRRVIKGAVGPLAILLEPGTAIVYGQSARSVASSGPLTLGFE